MEHQQIINAIGTLSGTLDALTRAKAEKEAAEVIAKIIELTKKL